MSLYFTDDWRAVPGHDSYGHDVETAYLLLEAAEALGRHGDARTERMARMLADRALARGWDDLHGGIFREGTTFGPPEDTGKDWWEQMECLNTLLVMHERYGRETPRYFERFRRQWAFVRDRQIDREHRGVFESLARDGTPTSTTKGKIWKAAYHDGRTLLNVAERLRGLAGR
jgi:mannobiose 2-epimerase